MGYLFTSESVSEGHPDKVADQISDAVLDKLLAYDPSSKVACETLVTTGQVVLAGEVKTKAYVDLQLIAREVIKKIGYTKGEYMFESNSCGVLSAIHEQSPDIAQGVDESWEAAHGGAADDPYELIGAGVVAENTLKDEIRELDYLLYLLDALVIVLESDTRHTRIESDMELHFLAEGNRPIRQALCHIIGIDILRYIIVYQQIVLRGRSITENENRLFYTCAAKLDRLFNDGDAEIIDLALKLMRKLDRAVTVAVSFDNRENLCPLGYAAFALAEIVKNRIYIYPCIYTMILHRYRFLCQIIWASGAVSIPFALSSAFIRFANSTALTPSP